MLQPFTKSYTFEGAEFKGRVTAIYVAPEIDVITDCDPLRTAD